MLLNTNYGSGIKIKKRSIAAPLLFMIIIIYMKSGLVVGLGVLEIELPSLQICSSFGYIACLTSFVILELHV